MWSKEYARSTTKTNHAHPTEIWSGQNRSSRTGSAPMQETGNKAMAATCIQRAGCTLWASKL